MEQKATFSNVELGSFRSGDVHVCVGVWVVCTCVCLHILLKPHMLLL